MANTPKTAMAKLAKIQAEVATEEGVKLDLRGQTIDVKPFGQWTQDALEDLHAGSIRGWAEGGLTEESLETWRDLKPTVDEVLQFFADYSEASGQDLGK